MDGRRLTPARTHTGCDRAVRRQSLGSRYGASRKLLWHQVRRQIEHAEFAEPIYFGPRKHRRHLWSVARWKRPQRDNMLRRTKLCALECLRILRMAGATHLWWPHCRERTRGGICDLLGLVEAKREVNADLLVTQVLRIEISKIVISRYLSCTAMKCWTWKRHPGLGSS